MLLHKTLHKVTANAKIVFHLTTVVLSLCTKEVMPMESQLPANIEQLNYIRKTFLEDLITHQKDILVSKFNVTSDAQTSDVKCDIFLSHNQYELIGTSSGDLIVTNTSNKSYNKIKAHHNAVSSLTAQDNIVATGSRMDSVIRRWEISTCKMHDKITCQSPIIFMHTLNNLLFCVDTDGNITLRDWESGCLLYQIETKISQPILNVLLDAEENSPAEDGIIIIGSTVGLRVKFRTLVDLDASICSLREQQTASLYNYITSSRKTHVYTKWIEDANLPQLIRESLINCMKLP